ncbi:hypothetical protein BPO_0785 [Bergeyella porcorum]|uniref:Antitoxin n=1 Tax=Bergeyella porcorum TaxID=1735111 RepID=A0AAU0F102_9FLAO
MQIEVKKWLYDIQSAIVEIESYFNDYPKDFFIFQQNIMMKRAVERNLEIIGEATNRILKIDNSIHISNARNIVGLRNQIIHAYDSIQDEIIWGIIVRNIPHLKQEIENILASNN